MFEGPFEPPKDYQPESKEYQGKIKRRKTLTAEELEKLQESQKEKKSSKRHELAQRPK